MRVVGPGSTFELAFTFLNEAEEPVRLGVRFPAPAGAAFSADSVRLDDRPFRDASRVFSEGIAFPVPAAASRRLSARYLVGEAAQALVLQAAVTVGDAPPIGTNIVRLIVRGGGTVSARGTQRSALSLEHYVLGASERGRRLRYVLIASDLSVSPTCRAAVRLALPSGTEYRTGTTLLDGRPLADAGGVGPLWAKPGILIEEAQPGASLRLELEAIEYDLLPASVRSIAAAELLFEDGRRSIIATDRLGASSAVAPPRRPILRGRESVDVERIPFETAWEPERMISMARELAVAGVRGLARHLFVLETFLAESIAGDGRPLAEMREALHTVLERLFVRVQLPEATGSETDTGRLREATTSLLRSIRTESLRGEPPGVPAPVCLFGSITRTEAAALEGRLATPGATEAEIWFALAHLTGHGVRFCGTTSPAPRAYRTMLIETLGHLRTADAATFHLSLARTPQLGLDCALEATLAALSACAAEAAVHGDDRRI